jgi:hypothetical protein
MTQGAVGASRTAGLRRDLLPDQLLVLLGAHLFQGGRSLAVRLDVGLRLLGPAEQAGNLGAGAAASSNPDARAPPYASDPVGSGTPGADHGRNSTRRRDLQPCPEG